MAYIRPRQENIFDNFSQNYGLDPDLEYGSVSGMGSSGMNPSNLPPVESPFGQQRNRLPDIFGGQEQKPPSIDFGQGGFNPDISVPSQPTPQVPGAKPESDIWKEWSERYTPETQANERLNRLLEQAPQTRGPGIGRGLIAASMALGNRPTAEIETFKQAPYLREMADWKAKAEPFEKAAGLENQRNIQERTLIGQMLQYQTQADKNRATEEYNKERNRIAEIRALAQKFKAEGYEIDVYGDKIIGFNAKGDRIELGSSGGMNERDIIDLKGKWNVEAARQRGADASSLAMQQGMIRGNTGGDLVTMNGKLYRVQPNNELVEIRPPGGIQPGTSVNRVGSPNENTSKEDTARQQQRWSQLYDTDTGSRKWLKRDSRTGAISMKDPPTNPVDLNHYNRVRKQLYPDFTPPPELDEKATSGIGPTALDWLKKKFSAGTSTEPYDPSGGLPGSDYGGATPQSQTPPPDQYSGKNVMGGAPTPNLPPEQRVPEGNLRQKAIGVLVQEGKALTEANIKYVVSKGMVK